MPRGEVAHVDVVADARAVGRVVVIPKDHEPVAPPHRHLGDEGDEVIGNAAGVLANLARGMRPHGVEIAQQHHRFGGVSRRPVAQDFLDEKLGAAIGVDGGEGVRLVKGQVLRLPINRRRG